MKQVKEKEGKEGDKRDNETVMGWADIRGHGISIKKLLRTPLF